MVKNGYVLGALLLVGAGCRPKADAVPAGTDAGAAVASVPPPPSPPAIPPEPPPPLADKASEVPALEAKLAGDKAYARVWTSEPGEQALLLTAIADFIAYDTLHNDVDAGVKKAKLSEAVVVLQKIFWRLGRFPTDFRTRADAYLTAHKTEPRLGLWSPDENGKPPVDLPRSRCGCTPMIRPSSASACELWRRDPSRHARARRRNAHGS